MGLDKIALLKTLVRCYVRDSVVSEMYIQQISMGMTT